MMQRFLSPSHTAATSPAAQIMDRVEKVEQRAASSRKIAGAPQLEMRARRFAGEFGRVWEAFPHPTYTLNPES